MQPAVHPKPIRLILEVQASELQGLVLQILERFTARAPVAPPRPEPDPDDEDDADPAPARSLPPPAPHVPPAGAAIPAGYQLGALCHRSHRWQGQRKSLRRLSNNKCRECLRTSDSRRKAARPVQAPRPVLVEASTPRPALPPHLAMNAFLSPITCAETSHRYRDMPQWTLRYRADESCVMCVTQQSQRALAGD